MIRAALPDPSQPSFVLVFAALGAFVGATIARVNGATREDLRRSAEDWAYMCTAGALAMYLVKVVLDSV